MTKSRDVIALALVIAGLSLLSGVISAFSGDRSRDDRQTMYGIR